MNSRNNQQTQARELTRKLGVFALVRTALSSERSLMAWMRTSASLYSFGFSITRYLDYLQQRRQDAQSSTGLHRLGLVLIAIGILGLAFAAVAHFQRLEKMKKLGLPTVSLLSLPICATVALLAIGIAVLISISVN
jgi:putative membrane protein